MIFNNSDKPTGATVKLQSKAVEITTNGSTIVTPDAGYGGLSQVGITVDVPTGGAGITLPLSAEDIKATWDKIDLTDDITSYIDSGEPVVHELTFPENVVFAVLPVESKNILTAIPSGESDENGTQIIFAYIRNGDSYAATFIVGFGEDSGYSTFADAITGNSDYYLTSCEPVVYYHTI